MSPVRSQLKGVRSELASTMRLATAQEVKDMKRTIKNLEAEVARLRKQLEQS